MGFAGQRLLLSTMFSYYLPIQKAMHRMIVQSSILLAALDTRLKTCPCWGLWPQETGNHLQHIFALQDRQRNSYRMYLFLSHLLLIWTFKD